MVWLFKEMWSQVFTTKVIDNYIVDFYCSKLNLIIELDGSQHYEEKGLKYDRIRTQKLETRQLTVIRIPNNEIWNNFDGVCEYIDDYIKQNLGWIPTVTPWHLPRENGNGASRFCRSQLPCSPPVRRVPCEIRVWYRLKRFRGTKRLCECCWFRLKRLFGTKLCE